MAKRCFSHETASHHQLLRGIRFPMSLHCTSTYPLNSIRPTLAPPVTFHRHYNCYRYGKMKCLTQNLGTREPYLFNTPVHLQVKKKKVPLQAWRGPESSRKLRFPDFMTTAQDGGKVVGLTHRPPLPSGNTPGTHFC